MKHKDFIEIARYINENWFSEYCGGEKAIEFDANRIHSAFVSSKKKGYPTMEMDNLMRGLVEDYAYKKTEVLKQWIIRIQTEIGVSYGYVKSAKGINIHFS